MNNRGEYRQANRAVQIRNNQGSQRIKTPSTASKVILSKIRNNPIAKASPSIHQSKRQSTLYHHHPEERIWAGRTPRRQPRVPDAPKIKRDKMKQFYMVDMGRKMW